MADLDQATVDKAIDPYAPQIAARSKRRDALSAEVDALGKKEAEGSEKLAGSIEERGKAGAPLREKLGERLKSRPSARVDEEQVPSYLRPKGNDKELEQGMSALAVAAMLVGVATRQPFYGAAQAMTGFMKGYMDADEKLVKESMLAYDKNLAAIKERNAAKKRAVDAILKDYDNDLLGMQQQLKLIAAQYDDPILAQKVRVGSISDQRNIALEQLKAEGNAIDHLIRASEAMRYRNAMLAERLAKRGAGTGKGVSPTSVDKTTALQILKSDPRVAKMDDDSRVSLAAEVASRAKSLVAANEVADFAAGVDQAMDDLVAEGLLKPGQAQPWYRPDTPASFRRGGAAAEPGKDADLAKQALDAIAAGKDPDAVKQRYKELTGQDLSDGGV